jgi:methenyltetrahydromethanopterin cyclohydrolase
VAVQTSAPLAACLASQYAGWVLDFVDPRYLALGSGPARALARKEALFAELAISEAAERGVLALETEKPPPAEVVQAVADACGLPPDRFTFLYAPTRSLAGAVQVVARVVEVALHKAHELKFPLERIVDALGSAPLPPPHPDFVAAMGRTNDAIIFGGEVHLFVTGPAEDAAALANDLPSAASRDFGRPFAETFARAGGDFYAIDRMLFSPALAVVTALQTGQTFRAGRVAAELLDASFG